jgi:hypothetical protein
MAEELLTVGQVIRRLKLPGKNPASTVNRWMTLGVVIAGVRVFLGSTRIGRNRYATPGQLAAFLEACNGGAVPTSPESAAAERRKDEAGVARLAERLRKT